MRPIPTAAVLTLVHQFEQGPGGGFAAHRYPDPDGQHEAIGWGHLCREGDPEEVDAAQADALALADMTEAARAVCAILGDNAVAALTDGQYAALIDFTYNEGQGNFAASTLARLVKAGDFAAAANEFPRWDKSGGKVLGGLDKRRAAEKALWQA